MWRFILFVVAMVGLAVLSGAFHRTRVAPGVEQPLTTEQMAALAPKGRELTLAGNCLGCHSTANGPMGAGGVPLATPFGTIYSTNITPDTTYGIGDYTRADFHRALVDGVGHGGRNLYPAMPYVYTQITRPDDVDAIYAYVMSLPPIRSGPPANTGVFRLPVRPFMNVWTLLNVPDRRAPDRTDRSEEWNRGAYLVEGLGHCGSCHTPMNAMMGPDFERSFEGAVIEGLEAPSLRAETLAARGFDIATLTEFLADGMSPQGTSFGGMYAVTHFSTSAMERADVEAMATYLLTAPDGSVPPPSPAPEPLPAAASSRLAGGQMQYLNACAGCHGTEGEGTPGFAPALRGNATVALDNPLNLATVILNGVPDHSFPGRQRMYAMPPFAHELSDENIAELATWMRAQWGGLSDPVAATTVAAIPRPFD